MAKIPFSIDYRPQIESGEYKVVIEYDNRTFYARIVCWDFNSTELLACVNYGDREDVLEYDSSGKHIGKSVGRPDLFLVTPEPELSEFEERIFKLLRQYKECDIPLTPENIKAEASMLWLDFEKHFFNLYGREGEGDSALRSFYYKGLADGKSEALKDLPRWEKCDTNTIYNTKFNIVINGVGRFLMVEGHQIDIDSLEKLPGFNE